MSVDRVPFKIFVKKIIPAIAVALLLFPAVLFAQHIGCYTSDVYRERIKNHPEILEVRQALERQTKQFNARRSSGNHTAGQVYIIPVVFHIIHNYGGENISDAQVIDQVRILNDDFRGRSYDTASIVPAFKPILADCEIEFRLATIDPNGNCTNGIEHIPSMLTYHADDFSKLHPWPDSAYLNVWVVASLDLQGGVVAYAYYPGTAPFGADGVIMLSHYVGSVGTSSVGRSRVLTHEVGHYFNLTHTWGDTNDPGVACGDDSVSDTPVTIGWTTCNLNGATCGSVLDNVQNYMDYSDCSSMFTEGQKIRMQASLNSSIQGRINLWSPANLVATGTDGSAPQLCAPVTDFRVDRREICVGGVVQFTDLSWNGTPATWSWSFPGGNPPTSGVASPSVLYDTAGIYEVSLTTGNATGSDSITKTYLVIVNGPPVGTVPFFESFEATGFPYTDSYVLNPDGHNTWVRDTFASVSGSASIMINNFSGNSRGETDDYITPAVDLSAVSSLSLDFKLAHAQRDTSFNDVLQVFVSLNCGMTWTMRYSKPGYNLATAPITPLPFVPASTEWRQEHVNIIPYHNQPNVRFKFRNTCGRGNNIYIDDINVSGIVAGVRQDIQFENSFNIFPNPTAGKFDIRFELDKNAFVALKIMDALGQNVSTLSNSMLNAGKHQYSIDKNLDAGIYFVCFEKDGQEFVKKAIITE